MKDFDALLDEVLADDANVEPRPGMERRALAKAFAEAPRPSRKWRVWIAAATSIAAIGILVWTNEHRAFDARRATTPVILSRTANITGATGDKQALKPANTALSSRTTRRTNVAGKKTRPTSRREATFRIAPIEIEPLRIEPIEVASSTTGWVNTKGRIK